MKILLINGPNLNLLGKRETSVYGQIDYETLIKELKDYAREQIPQAHLEVFQSNHEGDIVDFLHQQGFSCCAIVINPGALTHTSIAIRDALLALPDLPIVEVHISNIHKREPFRKHSYIADVCTGQIMGLGTKGYFLAIQYMKNILIDHPIV